MRKLLSILSIVMCSCAYAGQGAEQVNSYFELWLKAHNFNDFEKREDGIFFSKIGALLDGEIYDVNELQAGEFYSVESRISVKFKNGRRLDDFVAGAGGKAEEAFLDSLQNFCLTTLHPIYAELFDHKDPHVRKEIWNVNGTQRRIFLSEWGQRGREIDNADQKKVEQIITEEMEKLNVSSEIHWLKLVVSGSGGKLNALIVTVDGVQNEKLIQRLASYSWPNHDGFYMYKLFFVVGGA